MILAQVDYLLVQHDADSHFIRFRWLNPAQRQVRAALRHGRELIREHQPTRAFIDLRGMPDLSLEDELWMTAHWMPVVLTQQLRQVTVLLSPLAMHNQMAIETLIKFSRSLLRFDIQFFTDEAQGLDWLLGNSPHAQQLQAEWHQAIGAATGSAPTTGPAS